MQLPKESWMKIPMQEKIAELETRIAALEKKNAKDSPSTTTERTARSLDRVFGTDWHKMWEHFQKVVDKI
jgi:hypothetical protein